MVTWQYKDLRDETSPAPTVLYDIEHPKSGIDVVVSGEGQFAYFITAPEQAVRQGRKCWTFLIDVSSSMQVVIDEVQKALLVFMNELIEVDDYSKAQRAGDPFSLHLMVLLWLYCSEHCAIRQRSDKLVRPTNISDGEH